MESARFFTMVREIPLEDVLAVIDALEALGLTETDEWDASEETVDFDQALSCAFEEARRIASSACQQSTRRDSAAPFGPQTRGSV